MNTDPHHQPSEPTDTESVEVDPPESDDEHESLVGREASDAIHRALASGYVDPVEHDD